MSISGFPPSLIFSYSSTFDAFVKRTPNILEPNQLEQLLLDAGFHQTTSKPISGGISTILCGIKKA